MDTELLDLISRTRPVILEILGNRGYDTTAVADMAPDQITKIAATNAAALNFKVERPTVITDESEGAKAPTTAHVLYWVEGATRLKLEGTVGKLWDAEENPLNPEREEVFVVLAEPFHEVFDLQAAKLWGRKKVRMSFFNIRNLVSNPARHSMVPPHRKLTDTEAAGILAKYHIKSRSELPRIIYHVDMQARVLGLVPGDIVEIRRASPTSGEYISYRVCTLS